MTKTINYKLQGDGRDSWEITEFDDKGGLITKYMVYDDPNIIKKIEPTNFDFSKLTAEQALQIKTAISKV